MRLRGRWVRTAIGVVVAVKLLGLIPFLAGLVTNGDRQGTQAAALAAEQVGAGGQAREKVEAAGTTRELSRVSSENPTAGFNAESAGLRQFHEAMRRRAGEIAAREAALSQREQAIAAAAKDLEKKIAHLESLGVKEGQATQPGMEELGKIYGTMKAEEAAPLLDGLDNETVRAIFAHMKQRQISAILPLMNRDKAVELTKLLGGRQSQKRTGAEGR